MMRNQRKAETMRRRKSPSPSQREERRRRSRLQMTMSKVTSLEQRRKVEEAVVAMRNRWRRAMRCCSAATAMPSLPSLWASSSFSKRRDSTTSLPVAATARCHCLSYLPLLWAHGGDA